MKSGEKVVGFECSWDEEWCPGKGSAQKRKSLSNKINLYFLIPDKMDKRQKNRFEGVIKKKTSNFVLIRSQVHAAFWGLIFGSNRTKIRTRRYWRLLDDGEQRSEKFGNGEDLFSNRADHEQKLLRQAFLLSLRESPF